MSWFRRAALFSMLLTNGQASLAEEIPSTYETIHICKQNTAIELPVIPNLRVGQYKVLSSDDADNSGPDDITWKPGDVPISVRRFAVRQSWIGDRRTAPVMETFLGRPVPYIISDLKVGAYNDALYRQWEHNTRNSDLAEIINTSGIASVENLRRYFSKNLTLFGRKVFFRCTAGLPVHSDDEERHSCRLFGFMPDGTSIAVSFWTASDSEGHWPHLDQADSLWQEPLNFLEETINKIWITEGEGAWPCN